MSEHQAKMLVAAIAARMAEVGLRLHPTKTRIVYCQDGKRRGAYEHTAFTFLGFTFRARAARDKHGAIFTSFLPGVSKDALKRMCRAVRRWRLHLRIGHTLAGLADQINPVVRGWMHYYGAFYRSAVHPLLLRINAYLMRWLRRKYRKVRPFTKALACWRRIIGQQRGLLAHWAWVTEFLAGTHSCRRPRRCLAGSVRVVTGFWWRRLRLLTRRTVVPVILAITGRAR